MLGSNQLICKCHDEYVNSHCTFAIINDKLYNINTCHESISFDSPKDEERVRYIHLCQNS